MKHIILSALVSVSLLGCKKGSPCEQVVDHTLSLMPDELKSKLPKDDAIAKCEKLSPEARQCALDASSLEDLMKCPKK
jgi:hypothetical protein